MADVYKIMSEQAADAFRVAGWFDGAEIDLADGYIHLSIADQVGDTLSRHFAGRTGLVLVTVDPGALPTALRWEPARGGALFPHLYDRLPWDAVRTVDPLPLTPEGTHRLPPLSGDMSSS